MNIKSIITAAIALLISTACSGGAKQEKVMNKDGKSLVVFFSHAGDNYAVGNIEAGTRDFGDPQFVKYLIETYG